MAHKTYPELANLSTRLQELETQGYTVFPDYLDRDTTAAVRAHIDDLVGPIASGDHNAARHVLRHPIQGAIMSRLVNNPATLELAATLIGSHELRMREPLCYHASSTNRTDRPRYVYFTSFYHPSAARLIELIHRTKYRDNFPDSLRQGLPLELQSLLD